MIGYYIWIFVMILQCAVVTPRPTQSLRENEDALLRYNYDAHNKPKEDKKDEQVISVRITSSVAVARGGPNSAHRGGLGGPIVFNTPPAELLNTAALDNLKTTLDGVDTVTTDVSPKLIGANIEFLKQLNAKKDTQAHDQVHPFQMRRLNQFLSEPRNSFDINTFDRENKNIYDNKRDSSKIVSQNPDYENLPLDRSVQRSLEKIRLDRVLGPIQNRTTISNFEFDTRNNNETYDTLAEPSNKSIQTITNEDDVEDENFENVPLARSVPMSPSSKNYIQGPLNKSPSERGNNPSQLTTVSFDILHDLPQQPHNQDDPSRRVSTDNQAFGTQNKFYDPPKVYSQPAKIYSEPAKIYSEPAKIYSEPAKIYSEPAKIYSEPAKIYSEPAKFYSEPASLHLNRESIPNYTPWQNPVQSTAVTSSPWQNPSQNSAFSSTVINTTPTTLTMTAGLINTQRVVEQLPEKNYEVDEKVSIQTDGRSHGVQETTTEKCKEDNCKVGYVVEGRQYKKYRVEERTPDGFIVGEYGVVRNEDGALRGVRYTADSEASPRLIYDALMKFLQL